ncbi:uncharacterized protein BDZ99DRAFT_516121 [Mytilinidion resinicola]|uniref:F-box domain-containing protein n=1 Tax=Mytilinidion resinicola TaxID=574789 RepID=A0A6A6Z527_9PEZI|nr:uncharacterized protein BDZ99DRAFT_516121 [Mytilinidion resinicola]KAF2815394.1 hypothetical protein BDZ99DRAFT_516121 [Mytilinidion resinicola]
MLTLNSPHLVVQVREVRIEMERLRYCSCKVSNGVSWKMYLTYIEQVFDTIDRFPSITAVKRGFIPNHNLCENQPYNFSNTPLSVCIVSDDILTNLFRKLHSTRSIQRLQIENIGPFTHPGLQASEFRASAGNNRSQALRNLKDLRLHVAYDKSLNNKTKTNNLVATLAELPSLWLRPAAASLCHLTLGCHEVLFGYYPKLDLKGVHFPCLKTLALRNFAFSHEWQLEWLTSHSDTLREAYLGNCAVLVANDTNMSMDADSYPIHGTLHFIHGIYTYGSTVQYPLRWDAIFDVCKRLPHLRQFGCGAISPGKHWERHLQPPTT